MVYDTAASHSGLMAENSASLPPLPKLLSDFVETIPGIDNVLLFTRDSLVHAYSRGMTQETAEHWSSILGSMLSLSDRWGNVTGHGACDHILHKDRSGRINILALTPGSGAGLFLSPGAEAKKCAYDAHRFFEELKPSLPQEVPTAVGAARHLQGVA